MLTIERAEPGRVVLGGRFDAAQADRAAEVLDGLSEPTVVDLAALDYISSMGLGLLLKTHKRLMAASGAGLTLANPNEHIRTVFRYSGFNQIFPIQPENP